MEAPVAEALTAARENIIANPMSADAWGMLGALCDAHEIYADAETCYEQAYALGRADLTLVYNLGVIYEYRGRPSRALEMLSKAAQMEPSFTPVHTRLGDAYGRMGELEKARNAYERALAIEPDHIQSLRGLGQVLIDLGDEEAAVRHLEKVAAAVPGHQAVLASLAQAYGRLGRREEAAEMLERSRRGTRIELPMADPVRFVVTSLRTDSPALKKRARELVRNRKFEEAKAPLRTLIRATPGAAWPRAELGRMLLVTGEPRQAISYLEEARARAPENADICFYYGQALDQIGEVDAAIRQYRKGVARAPNPVAANRLAELTKE
jgi:tetratricopeptide (TPR) repeat protein